MLLCFFKKQVAEHKEQYNLGGSPKYSWRKMKKEVLQTLKDGNNGGGRVKETSATVLTLSHISLAESRY